jgi:hypothetical protein
MSSDGSGQATLVPVSFGPTFSPSGSTVLLSSATDGGTTAIGNNHLYTVGVGGAGPTDTGSSADTYPADWGSAPLQPSARLASKVVISKEKVALHCNDDGRCHLLGTVTAVEHNAKGKHNVTVTVARGTVMIASDSNRTLHLKLTAAGRNLLQRFGKLRVELTVTVTNANPAQAIVQKSGKFAAPSG